MTILNTSSKKSESAWPTKQPHENQASFGCSRRDGDAAAAGSTIEKESCEKELMRASKSSVVFPSVVIFFVALILRWCANFENVADLKFFGGIGLPFDIYHMAFPPENTYVTATCERLGEPVLIDTSVVPILFKKCLPNPQNLTIDSFVTFPDSINNAHPSCGDELHIRESNFTNLNGEVFPIQEKIPCRSHTLASKVDVYKQYNVTGKETDGYFDVHVNLLTRKQQIATVENDWKERKFVPSNFGVGGLGRTPVIVHFFNAGKETAVNYLHSHMDRFLSFGVRKTKDWELIHPYFHHSFKYIWSGNANVAVKELKSAPRVVVRQEAGDILFIPPWWIHKTTFDANETTNKAMRKSVSFNLHFANYRSVLGLASFLFTHFLGVTDWFYDSKVTRENMSS